MSQLPKYFFMILVEEKGKINVRFLPNQTILIKTNQNLSGVETPLLQSDAIQVDAILKTTFKVGTLFATINIEKRLSFYKASDVHALPKDPSDPLPPTVNPFTSDMLEAYEEFCEATAGQQSKKASTLFSVLKKNPKFAPPIKTGETGFFIEEEKWFYLLRNVKVGKNVLLKGPSGTGKTKLVNLIAEALNYKVESFDMGTMRDPITSLLGTHRIADGKSFFDLARFPIAIQQKNTLINLDELNRAPATSNNILLPCTDERRTLIIEAAMGSDERIIPVHRTVSFIATANLGSEYSGTNSLDRALEDRFLPIELDYLDEKQESELLVNRQNIDTKDAYKIAAFAKNLRELHKSGETSNFISTRYTLEIAELVKDGLTVREAIKLIVSPLFEVSERDTITNLLIRI